jgi:hypothetical protein
MNKSNYIDALKTSKCRVEFTKVNGQTRTLYCTLQEDLLPPVPKDASKKPHLWSEETVSVWDLEAAGWRSFRVDSVLKFENGVEV